jgi:hypothetical protein
MLDQAPGQATRGTLARARPAPKDDGLPRWQSEALVVAGGYVLYQIVQNLVAGSRRTAVDRATWVMSAERHLHLDPELWLNRLLIGHHTLIVASGFYYSTLHFAVTPLVLVWLRVRRPGTYVPLRNTLVGGSLAALLVYWVLPLAPPRIAVPGVVDVLKVDNVLSAGSPSWPASMANQYAAMPSLHVAWAVWVALAVVVAFPTSPARHLAWLYPVSTTLVVMATGNHFLADAAAGAVLVGAFWVVNRTGLAVGVPARDIGRRDDRARRDRRSPAGC